MAEKRLDTVRLQNIALAYGQSAALMAAVELGLFTAVAKGADSIPAIAKALDLHPVNAERLVTMCTALELLTLENGRYENAPDVARFLDEASPAYAGPWMLFTKHAWPEWGKLAEHLGAKDLRLLGDVAGFTEADARAYHKATNSIGMGAGRRFCRQVDLSNRRKILDIGGGSGAYCIAAAQQHAHIEAVVFDLPPVVTVAREFIEQHGVADRVSAVPGDFTADPFPEGADVAIMASNLPMYGPSVIAAVVAKAFGALVPGGAFHLIGETLDDDRRGPISPAYWGIAQALQHTMGQAHSEADCITYLRDAGFQDVTVEAFVPGVLSRIHGTKPT